MAVHSLKTVQCIPVSPDVVWDFFSDPSNLPLITPSSMLFRVISKHNGKEIYAGQIIEYKVAPVAGIRLYWMTEITHVRHHQYFVDEQRFGPYALWHHQHHFEKINGGTKMTDIVHYKNPLGWLGKVADPLLVRPKLKDIFEFRFRRVCDLFGAWPEHFHNP